MSSLLAQLRAATHHDHHRLDRHPRLSRLMQHDLNREGYADALVGLHDAQSSLEAAVRQGLEQLDVSPSDSVGYRLDARLSALRDDLARLGARPVGDTMTPLAVPTRLETLIGLLYVLEGSRLGARVIAKHVRASLGPAVPLRFFAEANGGLCWPSFCALAKRHEALMCAEEMAHGARSAFTLFQHSLDASPTVVMLDEPITLSLHRPAAVT